jgi:hypothetical protein
MRETPMDPIPFRVIVEPDEDGESIAYYLYR